MTRADIARRSFLLFAGSVMLIPVLSIPQARAAYFRPRMQASDAGSRVRVRIWVSANVGPVQFNNHFLGTFYVPHGETLHRELTVGIASFRLVLEAKNQVIEAVIKMQGAMFATQQRVLRASISG